MPDFNPYEALGVGRKATPDAIKRAYRKKARSAHPDRAGGNADQMADINRAYALLSDESARHRYDSDGTIKPPASPEHQAGELVSSVVAMWINAEAPPLMAEPDLLPFVTAQLANHLAKIRAELSKRERAVAKVNRELKRLTRRAVKESDPIRGVLEQSLQQCELQSGQLKENEAVTKLAIELVK